MRGLKLGFLVSVCVLLVAAAPAAASEPYTTLPSAGPLSVSIGEDLSCQVQLPADTPADEFFPSEATPGDCGTLLYLDGTLYASDFGSHDRTATSDLGVYVPFGFVSQSGTSGDGSANAPFSVTTTETAEDGVTVTEVDSYVTGAAAYTTAVTVKNASGSEVDGTLYRAGDCYVAGSDNGFGGFDNSRTSVSCGSDAATPPTRSLSFVPQSSGATRMEDVYTNVWTAIATGLPFTDTCLCDQSDSSNVDNGAGLSWPIALAAGQSMTYSSQIDFGGALVATSAPPPQAPATAPSQPATPAPAPVHSAPSQPLCNPGANTGFLHVFKVTMLCLFSGEAFYDPSLKFKDRCIASVGFDVLTDLIPAGKIKILKHASRPIGGAAAKLAKDLRHAKHVDAALLSTLDKLGQAMTLVSHNPRDVLGLFITSDKALKLVAKKLTKGSKALSDLHHLQTALKGLFLELTGINDVEKCIAAFS